MAFVVGHCRLCNEGFKYDPAVAPSILVNRVTAPVCENCLGLVNDKRVKSFLQPYVAKDGAYPPLTLDEETNLELDEDDWL